MPRVIERFFFCFISSVFSQRITFWMILMSRPSHSEYILPRLRLSFYFICEFKTVANQFNTNDEIIRENYSNEDGK